MNLNNNVFDITQDRTTLVYNAKEGKSLLLKEDSLLIYQDLKNHKNTDEIKKMYPTVELDGLFEAMLENKLLINEETDSVPPNKNVYATSLEDIKAGSLLRHLRLNITEKCNLDCSYCFERDSNVYSNKRVMTFDMAKKALDAFKKIILKNNQKYISIRFFGGEPLLNWNLVKDCLIYIKNSFPEDINITYIINTNGTLLNDDIAKICAEYNINISVSMDGYKEDHDKTRKYINGDGSFDIIDTNLKYLAKYNCNFNLSCVCSDLNLPNLCNLVDYISNKQKELNINIPINFNFIQIRGGEDIDHLSINEKVKYLVEIIKRGSEKNVSCYGGVSHFVLEKLLSGFSGNYCGGIGAELSISPSGDIYPCSAQDIKIGCVDNIEECFSNPYYIELVNRTTKLDYCKGCEIEGFCNGGCAADVLSSSGSVEGKYDDCKLQKEVFKALVKEYLL